jgi:DNA-binding transcriptional LysR family regulator
MIRLSLHHLETLFWIARLGTYAAAADRLSTTQPAISGRIRELENKLGTKLFRKEGRRMVLNVRGRDLVQRCEPLMREMEKVLFSVAEGDWITGTVRLGSGEIAALSCLPDFVTKTNRELPRVTWNIDVDLTINLRQKLDSGVLDMALLVGPIDGNALQSHSIGEVKLPWLASKGLLSNVSKNSCNRSLNDAPVWTLSKPSFQYQLTVEELQRQGIVTKNINTCNHVKTLIELVLSGTGVAMLPEKLIKQELEKDLLIKIPNAGLTHTIEFFVAMRKNEDDILLNEIFNRTKYCAIL